jgi:hypothetical protein
LRTAWAVAVASEGSVGSVTLRAYQILQGEAEEEDELDLTMRGPGYPPEGDDALTAAEPEIEAAFVADADDE